MMMSNEVQKPDDATLILRRLLNAPQERVFKVWTAAEHIQQWMKPEPGMAVPLASIDLRAGGKYRIQMKMPDGEFFTAVGEFKEVKAPERLVYTWHWEKDGSGAEFLKRGEQTEIVLTHSRFATVESRDSHAQGWSKLMDSFASSVEKE